MMADTDVVVVAFACILQVTCKTEKELKSIRLPERFSIEGKLKQHRTY